MESDAASWLARMLRKLGNRVRLKVLRYFAQRSSTWITVGEVVAALRIAQSTASAHIAELAKGGLLIKENRRGHLGRYRACEEQLRRLFEGIGEYFEVAKASEMLAS